MKREDEVDARVALADGVADYLAAVRVAPPGTPIDVARLLADLHADRIAIPSPPGMRIATSFVAGPGCETPVRIYRPEATEPLPMLLYVHGGGFTTGSVESYSPLAMALAASARAIVVSVHYRRLPEATPRDLIEECYRALQWTAAMAEPLGGGASLSVAGDSAGAFVAAQLAILARDRGGPTLASQLLCYGMFAIDAERPAYRDARDPVLRRAILESMIATYRACDARDPAPPAPLDAADLARLPPAVLLGAEHDPLLDEGHAFAGRLRDSGVSVTMRVAAEMPHGFLRALRFSAPARAEMAWLGDAFRSSLQPGDE